MDHTNSIYDLQRKIYKLEQRISNLEIKLQDYERTKQTKGSDPNNGKICG